jgi:hypothetical protein
MPAENTEPGHGTQLIRIDPAVLAAVQPRAGRHRVEVVATHAIGPDRRAAAVAAVDDAAARMRPAPAVGSAPVPRPAPRRPGKLAMMLRNLPQRWADR